MTTIGDIRELFVNVSDEAAFVGSEALFRKEWLSQRMALESAICKEFGCSPEQVNKLPDNSTLPVCIERSFQTLKEWLRNQNSDVVA